MRHLILAAFCILSSSLAVASYPAVNDIAIFTGSNQSGAQKVDVKLTLELTDFNSATNSYHQETTVEEAGQPTQSQDQWMDSSQMISKEMVAQTLSQCASANGKLETVTVPAGTYPTCALPQSDQTTHGTIWVADVPFGVAKTITIQNDNSGTIELELSQITAGQP